MAIYTAYLPPDHHAGDQGEGFRLVPDAKAPLALVFPPIWLAWNRLWVEFLAWIVATVAIIMLAVWQPSPAIAYLSAIPGFYLLLEGYELIRKKLERDGWQYAGIVSGDDMEEAELRFVEQSDGIINKKPAPQSEHPPNLVRKPAHHTIASTGLFPE